MTHLTSGPVLKINKQVNYLMHVGPVNNQSLLLFFFHCLDVHGSNKAETPGIDRSETLIKSKFKILVVRINMVYSLSKDVTCSGYMMK